MLRRLLSRLQSSAIRQPEPSEKIPDDMRSLREIYLNLFEVQRSHALIDVAIDGVDAHYQSIILGIDPVRGSITIDDLFPSGFVGLPGQPVTVTVRLDGARRLTFNTQITSRVADGRDVDSYFLALPENLDYNQRRGAFRLHLGQGLVATSAFTAPDQQNVSARIRDLSSTGIRLELPQSLPLQAGDVLQDLQFDFAGRSFHCTADVRNLHSASDHDRQIIVGAAFRDLPRPEQRSLERMIMLKQRQQAQSVAA